LIVAEITLSWQHPILKQTDRQRGHSLLPVVVAGMVPGGTGAVFTDELQTPLLAT